MAWESRCEAQETNLLCINKKKNGVEIVDVKSVSHKLWMV